MSFTARKLIDNAFYLSEIVSREFQTVSGDQSSEGLDLLNDILAVRSIDEKRIPFFKEYNFNGVAGQEKYSIPGLLSVETFVFFIDSVRYSAREVSRDKYFGSARVDSINSLPYSYHVERVKDGSELYLYFSPDVNYPMTIWGKFALAKVTSLDEDLEPLFEASYLVYLRYLLSKYICNAYSQSVPQGVMAELKDLEQKVISISPKDLSIKKTSTLSGDRGISWADVNLGRGWTP
jgi:hypothetical protein